MVLGAWLRFANLSVQLPFHDEWHALLAASTGGFRDLLTTFGRSDRSVPVALYVEALAAVGGLDELSLWLPSAAVGLVAVALLPLQARRWVGPVAATIFSLLLALSPLLVYFSRSARPYGVAAPLALSSLFQLVAWRETGDRLRLAAWASTSVLSCWAMPVYLAFCFAPALFLAMRRANHEDRQRRIALLMALAVAATALTLLAGPALAADARSLVAKAGRGVLSLESMSEAARLLSGGVSWPILAMVLVFQAGGVRELLLRTSSSAWIFLCGPAALLVSVLAARPAGLQRPFVFARYMLPVGLLLLLLFACGIAWACDGRRRSRSLRLIAVAVLATTVAGSRTAYPAAVDNFGSMRQFHRLLGSDSWQGPGEISQSFYGELSAHRSGSTPILEVPYHPLRSHPYHRYQELHRQPVKVGYSNGECSPESPGGLMLAPDVVRGLSRLVSLDLAGAVQASGVRYLVLHPRLDREIPYVENSVWASFDAERCARHLEETLGIPPRRIGGLLVFDLAGADRLPE